MTYTSNDPSEIVGPIENSAFLSDVIQSRENTLKLFTISVRVDILLPDGLGSQWKSSEYHVVASDVVVVIYLLP
jgi:hypothetical protein